MAAPCEVRLHDASKIVLTWEKPGALAIRVFRLGAGKDGTGYFLAGAALLQGEDLARFQAAIAGEEQAA